MTLICWLVYLMQFSSIIFCSHLCLFFTLHLRITAELVVPSAADGDPQKHGIKPLQFDPHIPDPAGLGREFLSWDFPWPLFLNFFFFLHVYSSLWFATLAFVFDCFLKVIDGVSVDGTVALHMESHQGRCGNRRVKQTAV